MIRLHKLGLDEKDNPEFYKIVNMHNEIMTEWNRINLELHNLKQPKFFLFFHKSKLKSYNDPMGNLTKKYLEWNKLAKSFIYKPNFIFTEAHEKELGFIHFGNVLSDMINHLSSNMVLIGDNFVKVQYQHSNQVNFNIAIFSTFISLIGLSIAIWTIVN